LSALKKSTNYKKRSIGITMVAAAFALLLVAGTILSPTQSYARSRDSNNSSPQFTNVNDTDTSNLKNGTPDGVSVNLERRDQHIDQENLCFRANTCRQSDTAQNTLGNDNQVTGFADQSDNLQQSAAPTTANQTTPTPTPTPTPLTATLTVTKIISGNTTAIPAQFAIHVTGNNPNPPNFAGSTTGIDVTLGSGAFNVTETVPTGSFFTSSFIGDCAGTIVAGQHLSCTIINTPKTCEECFTSLLTTAQITALLGSTDRISIPELCATLARPGGNLESGFVNLLTSSSVGVSLTTANELVACLKAAGIVFV
jgi:hypothetical protein